MLILALSGCSALVYEVVWFQLLQFAVGSTAISLGILLAVYMGGLCLGSLLLPRFVSAARHPLRTYSLIELGIAAFGLLALVSIPAASRIYFGLAPSGPLSLVLRASIAGICLLPPTILMGASFPAAARWFRSDSQGIGWLGGLYTANIVGAVFGSLWAGFYLLRQFNMTTATFAAALLNLIAAAAALLLSLRPRSRHVLDAPTPRRAPSRSRRWRVSVVAALSGFTALGAEVVWTRLLALLLGATVYTFSLILAVFLLGLGIGSAIGSTVSRLSRNPGRALGICQLLLVFAIAWGAFAVYASLPYWPITSALATNPWIAFQLDIARCMWAVLPAALLWGASFPLALAAAAETDQDSGTLVAEIYAANTIGSILGALVCSFWLVPDHGTRSAQVVLAVVATLAALLMLGSPSPSTSRRAPQMSMLAFLVLAALLGLRMASGIPALPGGLLAFGRSLAYRLGAINPQTNRPVGLPEILYAGEGLNESVAVSQAGNVRLFSVSGKIEASTALKDMRLQRMLSAIPALVHPEPRSVLIVGFGAGVTSGSFVPYPSIRRIVICELEPLIPTAAGQYFTDANFDVTRDPRVHIIYDDARHFLATTRETFDIITSDPIHPWVKGSASLYSREYFDLVRRHLNPGGVVSQWVPLYQSSEETIRGEVATFFGAFPGGTVWANNVREGGYDLVLLGGTAPTRLELSALNNRLSHPEYKTLIESLASVGFRSVPDLLSTYAGREQDLAPWLRNAPINRDQNLWLQYQAGLETFVEDEVSIYRQMARYRRFPEDVFLGPPELQQELRNSFNSSGAPDQ